MNGLSATRLAIYLAGVLLGAAATWAAAQGLGTYDPATGMFDLHPVNINQVIGGAVSVGGNALAVIALLRGWGR